MITIKLIGATGYGGVGITELLLQHPEARIVCLAAKADVGRKMSEVYPHLKGFCDMPVVDPSDPAARQKVDLVIFATPDGVGMESAEAELKQGAKVIDYSGDFRFNSAELYADYATRIGKDPNHQSPHLLPQAVYGLPELHRGEIGQARLVGNVGCFAIGCILGLAPAAAHRLVELDSLICDCKSGVSGAGKKVNPGFHFPARQDHMNAYRLTGHQHVCEIERELTALAGQPVKVLFTPQVVPANRGILSCLYGKLAPGVTAARVQEAYREFHKDNYFVRLFDRKADIGTMHVRGSNFCNLIVDVDERTAKLRIISHIDNLMKGQAGNALQNLNLLCGFPESMGLDRPGMYP
jgi:N-acetyl-gamma-glutamyl-phosphate reductase